MTAIHGVVITLTNDAPDTVERFRLAVGGRPSIELGERTQCRIAAVLDAVTPRESHALHDWILDLPDVVNVDVVFSTCDGEASGDAAPLPQRAQDRDNPKHRE